MQTLNKPSIIKNHIYKQTHKEKSSNSNISIMDKEISFNNFLIIRLRVKRKLSIG